MDCLYMRTLGCKTFSTQGPKDKSYETKEWEFAVIDVSLNFDPIA